MGTVVEITVSASSEREAREAIREAFEEMQRIDDLMSSHRPESVVSRVNREGYGRHVVVGNEVFQVIRDAVAIGESSRGAFDITLWPLSQLWGFEKGGKVPRDSEIQGIVDNVGYHHLVLDNNTLSVGLGNAVIGIDLGGIAKGWAVDRAIASLQARGVRNAIVDAGGDLRVIGGRPGRGTWRIGVQHPRESGQLLMTLDLSDTAIVTSGDYERFFTEGGVRYHHILDPATGFPARGCQSVTVLAPTAAEADACATAAFVLGPERGLAFLRARPGVRGVIVGADAALHWTDEGLERMARR
jgi:thiamine biosynthesis lipoprotein